MRKSYIIFVLIIFLSACVTSPSEPRQVSPSEQPTPIPTPIVPTQASYEVERGEVVYQLEFSARIVPAVEQSLRFEIDGEIAQVYARRGDFVEKGDLLAELSTEAMAETILDLQTELAVVQEQLTILRTQAASDLGRAEIQRDMAQLNLDFAREQGGESPSPEQAHEIGLRELELQLAELAISELHLSVDPELEAAVVRFEGEIEAVEALMGRTELIAPFSGQVISFNLSPGQSVSADNEVGVIADTTTLEASASLENSELQELAEGMPTTMTVLNRPGELIEASIRRLPFPFGNVTQNTDIGENDPNVRIAFDDPAQMANFELGDRVRVSILLERHEDVVWLPPAALREFSGRYFVVVKDGEGERRMDVVLGIEGDGRIEILQGVEEGQTVIGP
jgi:multidrug efflux pump subunit AcrA (membrane-fusion protein)